MHHQSHFHFTSPDGSNFWRFLCIKAVHNVKTKSSSIILTPRAMIVPISAFLLFLVSEIACGEELARFCNILAHFSVFLQILHN